MNGLDRGVRGWPPSGCLHRRMRRMWVMLGLGLSACVVLLFRCLLLPLFSFSVFFDCGRAVRCVLPLGGGRVTHLVVLYGSQGADRDAEQLALTGQLFDTALSELGVVAREQPCLLVGDFNVEPTKIPCLAKGIMGSGLIWRHLGLLLQVEFLWLPVGKNGGLP